MSLISNAASSTVKGFDLEIAVRPSRNFDVDIAYGYLDAKYDSYVFNATTDFSGTRMVRAPQHSINVGVEWRVPVWDDGQLALRADYALTGSDGQPFRLSPCAGGPADPEKTTTIRQYLDDEVFCTKSV